MKYILLLFALIPLSSPAQSFSEILDRVVQGNITLKNVRTAAEAQKEQGQVGLTLADPEVEVAYLFGSPRESVSNRTDISVKQQFDWATLSGNKRRVAEAEALLLDRGIDEEKRLLREEAALLLTEITYYNKLLAELSRRKTTEDRLLETYQKMLDKGDATILDVNKARLAVAQIGGQIAKATAERDGRLVQLRSLAHDDTIVFTDTIYAASAQTLPADYETWARDNLQNTTLQRIEAQKMAVSRAQTRLAKAETKPSFSLGYTSEIVKGNNYHGIAVGVTLPLWANRNKINAAKKTEKAAEENAEWQSGMMYKKYRQLFFQAKAQQKVAEDFLYCHPGSCQPESSQPGSCQPESSQPGSSHPDGSTKNNSAILDKALKAGQMSLTEYLLEQKYYYESYDLWLEAERDAALAAVALACVKG